MIGNGTVNDRNNADTSIPYNVTAFEIGTSKTSLPEKEKETLFTRLVKRAIPSISETKQYIGVIICGFTLWGTSWFMMKNIVLPGGFVFNMAGIAIAGYVLGHTIERYTKITPMVGMTLVGALYRNFGTTNYLEYPVADRIDYHLRRIYPVIILTKGPLTWNWEYIKNNSVKVFSLATLPWIVECSSTVFFSYILLGFPWYWGLHLGAILASVSPAVVVPTVNALSKRGLGAKNQIAQLVGNAGGLDTAVTEGVFGIINSAIFYESPLSYRITKAILAVFLGIGLGISWGILVDVIPDQKDIYAPTIRSLLIFGGGLLLSYTGGFFGWGGTAGVAIMVCAGTAATRWSRRGWATNDNPVSEVYKLLWRIFEPILFTYSGYFLEAVLVRVAADSLNKDAGSLDKSIATQHANIIVIAILTTSTLGSALTTILGPVLLSRDSKVTPEEFYRTQAISTPASSGLNRNTPSSLNNTDVNL
ncbi:sodium/hydrogen exchanger 9B2-like isoform X2 [Galleria mellonella]|uniref:Sodium/hydrogen exchanger 9B2-like isoform X2 n=1 Tax=Galleria mellonella TaxID=7137 RepID=A0ABM3MZX8_GALME|nr:sodium/hydrogen exchanger 9B2-like isoform X2 [Galleria mellonella]